MLLRFTLGAAGAMVLAGTAAAQQADQPLPITSQVKDAGIYHVSTGTWTRGVTSVALAGPETLYDNTCTVGFYDGTNDGEIVLDSGRIPSTSSPSPVAGGSLTGVADNYVVNGMVIAYCTFEPVVTSFDLSFYDCYSACLNGGAALPTATVTFQFVNFPGGVAANPGGQGCWILTLDLENTTPSLEFNLGGDCNGVYDNAASTDSFAFSWTQTIPTTSSPAGPLMAGDPMGFFNPSCGSIGDGTTFPGAAAGPGSGIGVLDQTESFGTGGAGGVGCYWFGGYSAANPIASYYMQLQGAGDGGNNSGTPYCFGDGSGAACPCANFGSAGRGCANSSGAGAPNVGAVLAGFGDASMSNDTFGLQVDGVPGAKPGLVLRGINQAGGGAGNPVGDGIICAVGQAARSQVQVTSAGSTTFTNFQGNSFGMASYGVGTPTNLQFWYRDPQFACTGAGFNFSNGVTVTYGM